MYCTSCSVVFGNDWISVKNYAIESFSIKGSIASKCHRRRCIFYVETLSPIVFPISWHHANCARDFFFSPTITSPIVRPIKHWPNSLVHHLRTRRVLFERLRTVPRFPFSDNARKLTSKKTVWHPSSLTDWSFFPPYSHFMHQWHLRTNLPLFDSRPWLWY